eukprot:2248691-Alexandrium_andersonii.AAC.1
MSASLVGSEMCIRDSPIWLPSCPQVASRASCGVGASSELGGALESFGAVSYTHLTLPTICSV